MHLMSLCISIILLIFFYVCFSLFFIFFLKEVEGAHCY
ncbi:putative membrane protein [Escherichia coli 2845650]|nr:putative membrane protein [Escherichia coli 2845650]